jgi:hypothetical protein
MGIEFSLYAEKLGDGFFLHAGTNDTQAACDSGTAFTDVHFSGNVVEMDPTAVYTGNNALCSQDNTVNLLLIQSAQNLSDLITAIFSGSFHTPAGEYLVSMMMAMLMVVMLMVVMLMLMTALMVMVMMLMLMTALMVMVMMLMIVTALMIVMVMLMLMVALGAAAVLVMVMLLLFQQGSKLLCQAVLSLHSLTDLHAV